MLRWSACRVLPAPSVLATSNGDSSAAATADPAAVRAQVAALRWSLAAMDGGDLDPDLPLYLCGRKELLAELEPALKEGLGLEVRRLDRTRFKRPQGPAGPQAPEYPVSFGHALHEIGSTASMGLNFRRGEFAYHRAQQELQQRMRGIAALCAVLVAMMIGDVYMEFRQDERRVFALDSEIRRVVQMTLEDPVGSSPLRQLQEQIDLLSADLQTVNSVVPVSSSTTIDVLHAISEAIPSTQTHRGRGLVARRTVDSHARQRG